MTEITRDQIDRTRDYLLESTLSEDAKDSLTNLLDSAAKAANGAPDKVGALAEAFLSMSLYEIRQAVRAPNILAVALHEHTANCPLRTGVTVAAAPAAQSPTLAAVRAWLGLLSWRVIITLAVLSFGARGPQIVETVARLVVAAPAAPEPKPFAAQPTIPDYLTP